MRYFILCTVFISFLCSATPPHNFSQAKKIAGRIFSSHPQTLYCQCLYDHNTIDLASCNMLEASPKKRAHRLEWEHMMPAEQFGHHFACWREPLCEKNGKRFKGRACCAQIDSEFRQLEAELYNLWPSVGLVNGARSNYRFAALTSLGTTASFYGCAIAIDSHAKRVEPADVAKGLVARAHLFLSDQYGINLSRSQRALFLAWNRQFPPTAWEKQWAQQVAEIEGYDNPWITHAVQ